MNTHYSFEKVFANRSRKFHASENIVSVFNEICIDKYLNDGVENRSEDISYKLLLDFLAINSTSQMYMDVGFGVGDNILYQLKNSDACILGCDPFFNGAIKLCQYIKVDYLKRVKIVCQPVGFLLSMLPNEVLTKVYVLFPDPWPKKRHNKRRIFSNEFLSALTRVIKKDGEVYAATDNFDYACMMQHVINDSSDFFDAAIQSYSEDLAQTKYMKKSVNQCYSICTKKI
ncbi:tRNA (guanine(46)-N(7))-methyltransferase TrmB [Candidatus Gromoviella agglomerans]|uniref:tRNA (guanine(46)-N(7))-methyltransferase TrmB n=1 Tax=Candidatus Gromoviella agglomerans TaxID=2806609 RepID=UPI001E4EE2F5|nr:hypothetical protein [Candidatus Gromoviella agglomerans]UFX98404.1 tRNA (guanine-N(7)-)-methyltransferase [Candidatus Gromoviella agglomerans]